VPAKTAKAITAIDVVLRKSRPLFVAFEREGGLKKRHRGRKFVKAVTKACDAHGIMLLTVKSKEVKALSTASRPGKWDVAEAVAALFPELADKVPPRRRPWQSEDERIGVFMALAAAVAAWDGFRRPH
jgi:hypothetical protein